MTNPNKTLIAMLLDRSGSMQSIKDDTEGGFNSFIAEQRKNTDGEVNVTLAQFDDKFEIVYSNMELDKVPPLKLSPRGMTALHDAIGKLVTDTGRILAGMDENDRPGKVIVVTMTDGHENASREWTRDAVKKLIKQQETDYDWTFLFLGATLDAVETAGDLGISRNRAMSYNSDAAPVAFAAISDVTTSIRSGGSTHDVMFSDEFRSKASGK
jgi:uncharacterized protein YegL